MRMVHWMSFGPHANGANLVQGLSFVAFFGLFSACGGGGSSSGVVYDPDATTQALSTKVSVDGLPAKVIAGTPPETSTNAQLSTQALITSVDAELGQTSTVPLEVTSSVVVSNLYAKVVGATQYFSVNLTGGSGTAASRKMDRNLNFAVDIPSDLEPGGRLCFEFSALGDNGDVSNVDTACLQIRATTNPAPTSAPTAAPTPTPAATPGPTTTPSPTEAPNPTALPTPTAAPNSANCDFEQPDYAYWSGSGTDTQGNAISFEFTSLDPSPKEGEYNYFFTDTSEESPTLKLGASNENDDGSPFGGLIYLPGYVNGTGQYTAGADDTAACGYGRPTGNGLILWDQRSASINVTRFERCGPGTAYVELQFQCEGEYDSNPTVRGTAQGEFRGRYSGGNFSKSVHITDLQDHSLQRGQLLRAIQSARDEDASK